MTIKYAIFNGPNSLWYDYGHEAVKENPDLIGAIMPNSLTFLAYLAKESIPFRVVMSQCGPLYGKVQPALAARVPNWQTKDYPTPLKLAQQLVLPLKSLNLMSHRQPIFLSVYDPYLENLLQVHPSETLPEIGYTLALAGQDVASELDVALAKCGINATVIEKPEWHLPAPTMLYSALADMQKEQASPTLLERSATLYIGHRHKGNTRAAVDEWAARNAGMQFLGSEGLGLFPLHSDQSQEDPSQEDNESFNDDYELP